MMSELLERLRFRLRWARAFLYVGYDASAYQQIEQALFELDADDDELDPYADKP